MKVSPESTSKMMKNKHEKEEPQKIAPNYVTPNMEVAKNSFCPIVS